MKRTKNNPDLLVQASEIAARAQLAARLGQQYGGDRNLYTALGYKTDLRYQDYLVQYFRQDMAKVVIDRPVEYTWQGDVKIRENENDQETALEKAWDDLNDTLHVIDKMTRVDRLAGLGKYGVLLLGLSDVKTQDQFSLPAKINSKLIYVKPYGEGTAVIQEFETDTSNPRYGQPKIYQITIQDATQGTSSTINVHYSRIIHVVEDILESEIEGIPRLESIFNRLMDLEKIAGGDAEMFWRNARPGFSGKLDPTYTLTPDAKKDINDQIEEYDHGLKRFLINTGFDLNTLSQPVADPKNHVDVQLQLISAKTNIPKRILTGSERGELSSAQDSDEWRTYLQNRREKHAEIRILRPFIDRLIELKVLPKPSTSKYVIKWSDLFSLSQKEKSEIGRNRAAAAKDYVSSPALSVVLPPKAFMEFCLGLDDDQIELINEMVGADVTEEQIAQLLNPEPAQQPNNPNQSQDPNNANNPDNTNQPTNPPRQQMRRTR
jgi:uncharacterized protein